MQIHPIGFIKSIYKEKFGTPRQSGVIQLDQSEILFEDAYSDPEFLRGLDEMSHLWIIFGFHQVDYLTGQTTVRPPRLGGKQRMGIFACRTPHRPNQLGLSLVSIAKIGNGKIAFLGGDMVDGTPVYDIKPYHPTADRPELFATGYIEKLENHKLNVQWQCPLPALANDRELIENVIALDPRPSYQKKMNEEKQYGLSLKNFNIRFIVKEDSAIILSY